MPDNDTLIRFILIVASILAAIAILGVAARFLIGVVIGIISAFGLLTRRKNRVTRNFRKI